MASGWRYRIRNNFCNIGNPNRNLFLIWICFDFIHGGRGISLLIVIPTTSHITSAIIRTLSTSELKWAIVQ